MANPEHVELVKQGTAAVVRWREENRDTPLDLSGADLNRVKLCRALLERANLSGANLVGADLTEAHLTEANLTQANLCQAILGSAFLERANLSGAKASKAAFNGANLCGADLSSADLAEARLNGSNLSGANLVNADLRNAILPNVDLSNAELGGARLVAAILENANLTSATLIGTELFEARLCKARLNRTVLIGANLAHANLSDVDLRRADLSGANLDSSNFENGDLRNTTGIRFNNSSVRGARFSPRASDPWSVLRRHYTGPKLAFLMALTLAAFLPFVAKTFFWVGVSKVERQALPLATTAIAKTLAVLEKSTEPLPPRLMDWTTKAREYIAKVEPWLERYRQFGGDIPVETQDVEQAIDLVATAAGVISIARQSLVERREDLQDAEDWLGQAQQLIRVVRPSGKVKQRRIFELLLGLDQSILTAMLIVALLLYNILRGTLTYFVGPLREEEERTGFTPSWNGFNGYAWLWRTHRVASVLFWASIASGLYHLSAVLWTPVLVPG